ncbi:MAG TPA: carboxypeptidase regulatory-like domain-containing protein, partial [Candidatus Sulfotelmatobacter sp.]|nr:carboxypeptidase regulatory-like domain-containing protein [Candidatus Sulfotelmatobacter sp.]
PGTAFNFAGLSFRAGDSNLVLVLKPAGAIEGRIVQADSSTPIAGARVLLTQLMEVDGTEPAPPTGPDGIFRLLNVRPGEHTLRVTFGTNQFAEWVCEPPTVTVRGGATNRDLSIAASRGAVLEVSVRDLASNQPLQDVAISVSKAAMGQAATTAADGLARLRLLPGEYYLFAQKEGLRSFQTQVTLESGQTNRQTVTLEPGSRLTGLVLGPDGQPAPKVSITLFPFQPSSRQTDAQGRFTLAIDANRFGNAADYQRLVIARDLAHNLAAAVELDPDATNLTVRLQPALTLVGRATDTNSKPLTNGEAQVMLRTERMSSSLGTPVRLDPAGRFEVKGLVPDQRYSVSVSAKGFGRKTHEVEAKADSRQVEMEPIQLPLANLRIAGVVVNTEDKPVAGAMIHTYGEDQPNLSGRTDEQGRFAFEQVCAGTIQVSANSPRDGGYGSVTAEGGETNITLQLGVNQSFVRQSYARSGAKSVRLSGVVTDPDGQPAAKVSVRLFPNSTGERLTDAQGRFTLVPSPNQFGGQEANQQVLLARDPARNLAVAVEVEPEATNANLKLGPALTLTGRVLDSNGKPITNAQAQTFLWTERTGSSFGPPVHVDADGRFEVKGLAPSRRYSLDISAKGFGRESRNVEEAEGRRVDLEPVELPVANQRIAGIVVDADDKPVARASVNTYGNKQPQAHIQTDAKGQFAIDQVCAGSIQLYANSPRGGYGNGTAEAGDTNIVLRIGSSPGMRSQAPQVLSLKGKPLPDLAPLGLAATDCPANQPVLAVLIDAEQRPSRRLLRLLGEQAAALKAKPVAVVVLQAGTMSDDAFASWKQETALPFPIGRLKENPEKARAAWGAKALPWLILADQSHRVTAEGFAFEELETQLKSLGN